MHLLGDDHNGVRRGVMLAAAALAAAVLGGCSGQTVESGSGPSTTAVPTSAAGQATSTSKPPASSTTSSTAKSSTTAAPSSTTTSKPTSTTAPSGTWPKVGDSDLQPPAGYTDLGGGSISDTKHLSYSVFKTPSGGYVAAIDETSLDNKGRVATRVVKAVFPLPAANAGETLANGCAGSDGTGFYIGYVAGAPAGAGTVHPTRAWRANADPPGFTAADAQAVDCHTAGN